jgi:hypothetical protein
LFFGGVHTHAAVLAERNRPPPGLSAFWRNMGLPVIILLVVYGQINLVGYLTFGRDFGRMQTGVQLRGVEFFAPTLKSGDLLDIRKVDAADIPFGSLVSVNNYTPERVLGVAGDELVLRGPEVLRNQKVLPRGLGPLIKPGTTNVPDQVARVVVVTDQRLVVGPGEVGVLFWGRELRSIPAGELNGRIFGILAPQDRRRIF